MSENTTRFNIPRDPRNPQDHVDSGYEGDSTSDSFTIPPCGIEDADMALFRLFDRDIGFTVRLVEAATKQIQIKKPFVIFATGERFALAKRLRPPRDHNNVLMLPAISIRRTSIDQTSDDITGRGINQFSGPLAIKRRLEEGDRDYQNLVNRLGFKHLSPVSTTRRDTGADSGDLSVQQGGLLETRVSNNNMWEIITIPQPQFFTASYEVVFWTSFAQHMNYMIETFISSFLPNDRIHKLVTDKGYWFLARTDDIFSNQENIDDFTEDERILRYTFNVTVKGYVLASQHPTNAVPVRRWVSSPNISFDVRTYSSEVVEKKHMERPPQSDPKSTNSFTLTDIDRDPISKQTSTTDERYLVRKNVIDSRTGNKRTRYVSILESNEKKGETVYRASDIKTLEQFIKTLT